MSHSYCGHGIDVENYYCTQCPPGDVDKLLTLVACHLATLEMAGFGGDAAINGSATVDAVNEHFEELRDAFMAANAARPKHGAPIGGYAEVSPVPLNSGSLTRCELAVIVFSATTAIACFLSAAIIWSST